MKTVPILLLLGAPIIIVALCMRPAISHEVYYVTEQQSRSL